MPKTVAIAMPDRLRKARDEVKDRRAAYELAIEQRNELIVEAIDVEGMTQQAVADLAGVHKSRITPILAGSQPDVGE